MRCPEKPKIKNNKSKSEDLMNLSFDTMKHFKKAVFIGVVFSLIAVPLCEAGFLDSIMKNIGISSKQKPDDSTVVSGLKEALSIGSDNAIQEVSNIDGYLGNQAIKVLMPEKIQKVADVLAKVGYQQQVDDFITSMNRAAEKAAPKAKSHLIDSIKEMTFDDARRILEGNNAAATDYFKAKTFDKLYTDFKPIVSSSMNEVDVTKSYKKMMDKYTSLPFMKAESLDLDHHVTDKALDGLFYMIAQEEQKIRSDPAARVTELLKNVFGN
jgi:hypothetical protein